MTQVISPSIIAFIPAVLIADDVTRVQIPIIANIKKTAEKVVGKVFAGHVANGPVSPTGRVITVLISTNTKKASTKSGNVFKAPVTIVVP